MKIIWTNKAKTSYEKIIDNLIERWTIDIVEDFENRTNKLLDSLKTNKKLCPVSKKDNLRKCVIHKNASVVYKINKSNIIIITFIDNRTEHKF